MARALTRLVVEQLEDRLQPSISTTPIPISGTALGWDFLEQQNQALIAQGHKDVLFLGDSITYYLAEGPGKPLWDQYLAARPGGAACFAVPGAQTSQVLWQVQAGQVAAVSPEVVVLLIGINNLLGGQPPTEVVAGIQATVVSLRYTSPQARILLVGLLPAGPAANSPLRAPAQAVNDQLSRLDDGQFVHFLDIGNLFLQPDGSLPNSICYDYLHPAALGYAMLTQAIVPHIQELLQVGQLVTTAAYECLFSRQPDAEGRSVWSGLMDQGVLRRNTFINYLTHSPEYCRNLIQATYEDYLDRSPDAAGQSFWQSCMAAGASAEAVKAAILSSAEYTAQGGGDEGGWLDRLYEDVLGRPVDSEGSAFWSRQLSQGTPRSLIAETVLTCEESRAELVRASYDQILARPAQEWEVNVWLEIARPEQALLAALLLSDEFFRSAITKG